MKRANLQIEKRSNSPADSELVFRRAVAGTLRCASEDGQFSIEIPASWLPGSMGSKLLRIAPGDLLPEAADVVALVDTNLRDPDRLVGGIVAIRTVCGIELRKLRNVCIGGHSTPSYVVTALRGDSDPKLVRPQGEFSIMGKVLKVVADL